MSRISFTSRRSKVLILTQFYKSTSKHFWRIDEVDTKSIQDVYALLVKSLSKSGKRVLKVWSFKVKQTRVFKSTLEENAVISKCLEIYISIDDFFSWKFVLNFIGLYFYIQFNILLIFHFYYLIFSCVMRTPFWPYS